MKTARLGSVFLWFENEFLNNVKLHHFPSIKDSDRLMVYAADGFDINQGRICNLRFGTYFSYFELA
jgi:hypothetical protein